MHMELFDLYNEDRIPLGRTMVRGEETPRGAFRLAVRVCIFNSRGEMLIQQRQPFKSEWSGYWDTSCGGAAVAGENSRMAAERETEEELGIRLSLEGIRPVLTLHFDDGFDDIYTVTRDCELSELHLQPEEVRDAKWATQTEIHAMIDSGAFIPYSHALIDLLFLLRERRGAFTRNENGT